MTMNKQSLQEPSKQSQPSWTQPLCGWSRSAILGFLLISPAMTIHAETTTTDQPLQPTTESAEPATNTNDPATDTDSSQKGKATASPGDTDAATQGVTPERESPASKRKRLTSAIESFTPTEEISADNAVAFPVDI